MDSLGTAAPAPKVRVLVADDEEVIAKTLAAILELAGYEVIAVFDGEAAVKLLDRFKPDLLLTDITMPCASGIEVASITRRILPRCKILLFSGHAELQHVLRLQDEVLPFDLVVKPVHPTELLALLRKALRSEHPALLVPIDMEDDNVH